MSSADPTPASDRPKYIGVECHVCGTRMYGLPQHVGRQLKCPDCGARTVLPPPPKERPKNIPAALEGEQYELWEVDDSPFPSQILAAQPKYIAVRCRRCDTIMYATEGHVGETIACPDCGQKHVVPEPVAPPSKRSVLAADAETPPLDPNAAPGDRPSPIAMATRGMEFEEEEAATYARAKEKSLRTGKPMEIDTRGRPVMPRWPLLSGVVPFLFSRGVPVRWFALVASAYFSGAILLNGLAAAGGGGYAAVYGVVFFAAGAILALVVTAAALSFLLTIITESSEGNREIASWPTALDWPTDALVVAVAAMVSGMPGWAIASLLQGDPLRQAVVISAGVVGSFPVVLLSQLAIGSPWAILSPAVLRSLLRCPLSWLTFYVETAAIAAGCIAAAALVADRGWNPLAVLTPLVMAALILYGRLLGRLGWRLAEAMG